MAAALSPLSNSGARQGAADFRLPAILNPQTPIARSTSVMRNCDDTGNFAVDAKDQSIWESLE
jgi:hypothetical protein